MRKHSFFYLTALFCGLLFLCSCEENNPVIRKIRKPKAANDPIQVPCIESLIPGADQMELTARGIDAVTKSAKIDSIFKVKAARSHFNGAALVVQKGVVLYRKSFGIRCKEGRKSDSLTIDAKFQLASLSKTFTAIATLKLIQEEKISLNDTLQKFFPELPYPDITVQMLLSHRSGLPYYAYAFEDSARRVKYNPNNAEIINWLVSSHPARYNYPNRGFSYNNTNYMLLASIIEQVSGMTYDAYIRREICEPLGMRDTWVITTPNDSININRTCGHERWGKVPFDYFDNVVGDKGVYSTVDDLYKWYLALNSNCLLNYEMLQKAFTPYSNEHYGLKNYGLGFRMILDKKTKKPKYIYHNGWWKGYNSLFWFIPETQTVIIILGNVRNRVVYDIKSIVKVLENGMEASEDMEDELSY